MRRPRVLLVLLAVAAFVAATAAEAGARIPVSVHPDPFVSPRLPAETKKRVVALGRAGRLYVVPGNGRRSGRGPVRRYSVEVEGGIRIDRRAFAARVHEILSHRRGWGGTGRVSFQRVARGPVHFRVTLASPRTTDRLCAPFVTHGSLSCANGGRAVLNLMRWRRGADAYRGELDRYRIYLVNHEVGHLLGHGHRYCPAARAQAPVMMQQTKGVGACRAQPWPLASERG